MHPRMRPVMILPRRPYSMASNRQQRSGKTQAHQEVRERSGINEKRTNYEWSAARQRILDFNVSMREKWHDYPMSQIGRDLNALGLPQDKAKTDQTITKAYLQNYASYHDDKQMMYGTFGILAIVPTLFLFCEISSWSGIAFGSLFIGPVIYHGLRQRQIKLKLLALEHFTKKE